MNVFIYSPCAGELMHLIVNNQSGLENKQNNTFFISLCPWNVLSYKIVSLAVFVCLVSITEHTTFDGLKLIWIKSGGKAWPRREGRLLLLCMHGGFCGRRSWQGAAVLLPALRQQLLRKRRRAEGDATCLALFPSLFSPVCLFLSPNRHAPDTRATHCLPDIHTNTSSRSWDS